MNGKPSLHHLTIDEVLTVEDDLADNLGVGVILVTNIEDESVSSVTHLHLEPLVPLGVETVVNDRSLGDPRLPQLHINEGVGHILLVIELAVPVLHIRDVSANDR